MYVGKRLQSEGEKRVLLSPKGLIFDMRGWKERRPKTRVHSVKTDYPSRTVTTHIEGPVRKLSLLWTGRTNVQERHNLLSKDGKKGLRKGVLSLFTFGGT